MHGFENPVFVLLVAARVQVAQTVRHRGEHLVDQRAQRRVEHIVVGILADDGQTDKFRQNDVVGRLEHDVVELVQEQRGAVLEDALDLAPRDPVVRLFVDVRIHLVRKTGVHDVLHDDRADRDEHIQLKIAEQQQGDHLDDARADREEIADDIDQIFLLIGLDNRALVRKEQVGRHRVEQIQQEDEHRVDVQLGESAVVLDEHREERNQTQSDERDAETDDAVDRLVELHQHRNPVVILLGNRLIQLEQNRTADAELRQRQHGQNIREQTADSQIGFAQRLDKHRPRGKLHENRDQLSADARCEVKECICRS